MNLQGGNLCNKNRVLEFLQAYFPSVFEKIAFMHTDLSNEMNRIELFPIIQRYTPTGTSIKALTHFIQNSKGDMGTFRKFDYGENENLVRYGQSDPPSYDFSKISTPIFLYYGDKDIYFTPGHKKVLIAHLSAHTPVKSHLFPGFGHSTFLVSKTADFTSTLLRDLKSN